MKKYIRLIFIFLIIIIFNQHLSAQVKRLEEDENSNLSYNSKGLGLIISFMPYYSQLSDETMRNYALTVGLSYSFNPDFTAEMRFHTGEEVLTERPYLPVRGKLLLGAGDMIFKLYLSNFNKFRVFTSAGIGLQTILTLEQKGYNGYGVLTNLGVEYSLYRDFSISTGLNYRRCYYRSFVNGGTWNPLQSRFTDNWLGAYIDLNVYFK